MNSKVKRIIQFSVFVLCIAAVAASLLLVDRIMNGLSGYGDGQSASDSLLEMNTVYIDDEAYVPKPSVKNYLLIGVDAFGRADMGGVASADFLAVISVDSSKKEYTVLLVNRDTMSDVNVYGASGEKTDTRFEQISMAHSYGSPFEVTNAQKCKNTEKAVSELFYGLEFDGYISFTMDAVQSFIDSVGGVSVLVKEDMTNVDDRLVEGNTVNLNGKLALSFVRAMNGLDDASNLSRMKRQEDFVESLLTKLSSTQEAEELIISSYALLLPYIVSDTGVEIFDEMSEYLSSYSMAETVYLPGKVREGEEHMEYYVDKKGKKELAVALFFDKVKK